MALTTWAFVRPELPRGVVLIARHVPARLSADTDVLHDEVAKVALIDLNKTLIVTKSGTLHGVDEHDWIWWDDRVPSKIRELNMQGFTIILTSNQGRFTDVNGNDSADAVLFKAKMNHILRSLEVPITVMVGCANDIYRKPRPGIWQLISSHTDEGGCEIDRSRSFVVGDAAGREDDHSDSDRHFAENLGISFYTPEEFFLGQGPQPVSHKFLPVWFLESKRSVAETNAFIDKCLSIQAIILMIGLPGAGKTTFYKRYLRHRNLIRVDDDYVNSLAVNGDSVNNLLSEKRSIVIDAANINRQSRAVWLCLADEHGLQAHALFFATPTDLCLHNDSMRALTDRLNPDNKPIYPRIPFLKLASELEEPEANEGFASITRIDFAWEGLETDLRIWKQHWL